MVKLSELTTAEEIHDRDLADPAYRAEYERPRHGYDLEAVIQQRGIRVWTPWRSPRSTTS